MVTSEDPPLPRAPTELDKVRERNSKLEKALRELVDYGGTLGGWDDARSYAKRILAEVP